MIDRPAESRQMLAAAYLTTSLSPISVEGEFDIGGYSKPGEGLPLNEDDRKTKSSVSAANIKSKGYFVGMGYEVNPNSKFYRNL